ncbi:MAG TPA: bifunctional DNA primase/polymerase [Arenicellales bacterium]|nr:bifunctional DNA primase/polymerase [Arenicellales bacterium]
MTDAKITMLQHALDLAGVGFHVFPLRSGGKKPAITGWPKRATTDPAQIEQWWSGRSLNIGIATERFGDGQALVVVDIDNKNGKCGDETVLALELEGLDLPPTWQVLTPTGGRHLYYVVDEPVKQGAEVLGPGVDIRSRGGYVVAPGSVVEQGEYVWA